MHLPLLHLQHRKQETAPFPHPDRKMRFLDALVYVLSVAGPLTGVPQVLTIWQSHRVGGLSLFYWTAQTFISLVWLTYGITHRHRPIIIANILWSIIFIMVTIGILLYR